MFIKSHKLIKFKFNFIVYSQNYIKVCKYTKRWGTSCCYKVCQKI